MLFDSTTPERFKEKVEEYHKEFPQLIPVFVEPENGRYFAKIFQDEVKRKVEDGTGGLVLTTYLDNDDALDIHFVEDIQRKAVSLPYETFITYDNGYQLFTDYNYVMRIHYPRNHFMSVIEEAGVRVKTIYGYGSHYYIDRIPNARIEHVKTLPMWCEVIHEKNMGNDAYFLRAKMMSDQEQLHRDFAIEETVQSGIGMYLFGSFLAILKNLSGA